MSKLVLPSLLSFLFVVPSLAAEQPTPGVMPNYSKLPLSFEANQGQTDPHVRFTSRGEGYSLFLTGSAAVLSLSKTTRKDSPGPQRSIFRAGKWNPSIRSSDPTPVRGDVLRMDLSGANPNLHAEGADLLPGKANYFKGNDPARWRANVPTYVKVRYTSAYPGIDLVYYGNQRQLEYDFVVAPHANPGQIRLCFTGAKSLKLTPGGNLEVMGQYGRIAFHKPLLYQEIDGQRLPVEGAFTLAANHTVRFRVGRYNPDSPLTIDPVLVYSTYLGGSNEDAANAIAVDSLGNAYLAGSTGSGDFPTTTGAFQTTNKGGYSAFVTKLNAAGSAPVYTTYLGGSGDDEANAIAVDASGNAYVAGYTYSTDFPVTEGAFQKTNKDALHRGSTAFVTKLNPSGSALDYSTFLGGSGSINENLGTFVGDSAQAIAVDTSGNAYVAGNTGSTDFPKSNGTFLTTNQAGAYGNAFVTKLNSSGSGLVYSTYLGGSGTCSANNEAETCVGDGANAIAVDSAGVAYVAGAAGSDDFPTTDGSQNPNATAGFQYCTQTDETGYCEGAAYDNGYVSTTGFLSILSADSSNLLFSSYLGGSGTCQVVATAPDGLGNIAQSLNGCFGDSASSIALDRLGAIYLAGQTYSTNFPVTNAAFQRTNNGGPNTTSNAFIAKYEPEGSGIAYVTYLGGSGACDYWQDQYENGYLTCFGDQANGIAIDGSGNAYVAGETTSTNFPKTNNAFQMRKNGGAYTGNAFVTELNPSGSGIVYSTYLGGSGSAKNAVGINTGDSANAIALDSSDNAYMAGSTASSDFPVTVGAFQTKNKSTYGTAFVAVLGPRARTTSTSLVSRANPAVQGASVAFTATVSSPSGTPTGSVTFSIDGKTAGTEPLSPSGKVNYWARGLTLGTHTVKAAYAGNATYPASTSAPLTETIDIAQAAPPIFSPAAGRYHSVKKVTLTDSTRDAIIHYTINGETPTAGSTRYTKPIPVSATTTIKAIAVVPNYTTSEVASGTYTIEFPPAVTTHPASKIAASSATLNAMVNDKNLAAKVTFAYGTSKASLAAKTAQTAIAASSAEHTVSVPVTGLKPNTTYYFQATATTAGGTVTGAILSFTTN